MGCLRLINYNYTICIIIYFLLGCLCIFFRVIRRFLGLVGDGVLFIFLNVRLCEHFLRDGLIRILICLSIFVILATS